MAELKFWHPDGRFFVIPDEGISLLTLAAEHEIGHAIVAHPQARIFGIGIGFPPERRHLGGGILMSAEYGWDDDPGLSVQCVVKAAGPAADRLIRGTVDDKGARGDLDDIEALTGGRTLEPYLTAATEILRRRQQQLTFGAAMLRSILQVPRDRSLSVQRNGRLGALFLDEIRLLKCLSNT